MRRNVGPQRIPVALLVLATSTACASSGMTVTPQVGAYRPGEDVVQVSRGALNGQLDRGHSMAIGMTAEMGWLRGTVLYATGATISLDEGVFGKDQIGEGAMLGAAADFVFRPFGSWPIQPYALGGAGMKAFEYSFQDESLNDLFASDRELALHYGAGVALMLGSFGLMVEVTDFLSVEDKEFGRSDAFLTAGLRFQLR